MKAVSGLHAGMPDEVPEVQIPSLFLVPRLSGSIDTFNDVILGSIRKGIEASGCTRTVIVGSHHAGDLAFTKVSGDIVFSLDITRHVGKGR